jgi:predicted site-specific integrase-resolvase
MGAGTLRRWVYAGRAPSIKTETGRVFISAWRVEEQSGERPSSQKVRCAVPRFWFETLSPFRIQVVNTAENHVHDLREDLLAILTSFSARWYGQWRGRKKTQAALQALKEAE